jgi:hypothetical protein
MSFTILLSPRTQLCIWSIMNNNLNDAVVEKPERTRSCRVAEYCSFRDFLGGVALKSFPKIRSGILVFTTEVFRVGFSWESIVGGGLSGDSGRQHICKVFEAGGYFATDAALAHKYALYSTYRGRSSLSAAELKSRETWHTQHHYESI